MRNPKAKCILVVAGLFCLNWACQPSFKAVICHPQITNPSGGHLCLCEEVRSNGPAVVTELCKQHCSLGQPTCMDNRDLDGQMLIVPLDVIFCLGAQAPETP